VTTQPSAVTISNHLTALIGRAVAVKPSAPFTTGSAKQLFGVYNLLPSESALVVRTDLALFGSMAGAMVGLPDSEVKSRLSTGSLDELMRDAIHEILNISSTVVTVEGRAVFQAMYTDPGYLNGEARLLLKSAAHSYYYAATVDGYQGGRFTILAPA